MFKDIVCPISNEKIDSNVSRLTIFISVLLVTAFVSTQQPVFVYIAALDYGIRAFGNSRFSPLRFIALQINRGLGWKPKMIDKAPKVFASRLGLICLFTASLLFNLNMATASYAVAIMAGSLFLLDALDVICMGCVIYHHLVFPFFRKSNI